jgi:hypothetical protein
MLEQPAAPTGAPDDRSRDEPSAAAAALSRVNAHAVPPAGLDVERSEFRGPLFAAWGEAMRAPALAETIGAVSTTEQRRRVGIPSSSDRDVWTRMDRATLDAITRAAEADRRGAWAQPTASDFARYVRDGDRKTYESAIGARQQRLTRAVVTAAATDDPGWLDEAADGVVLLCEQSTWSWAAHDDAHARKGYILADAASPYLDLGAGEIVAQLAIADRVLGDRWDATWPGLRERIRFEAETRVFTPFETRDDFWWLGYWRDVNNWNPWILGNVLLAAALLLDDPERVARIAGRALDSLDRYVATLPADGAIDEGVAYWWNGAARLLECLDLVARLTDGVLDAAAVPVVREVLRFPMRMQLGDGWYVNVADGWARSSGTEPWHVPFAWGTRLADARVVAWASGGRRADGPVADVSAGLPRLLRALSDEEWRDAVWRPAPLPATVWLPSVQLLVARARAGESRGLALAAKGGTNDENHNHKDLGSFIVASDGRPLLVDVGKPTYTAQTFSEHRYEIRAMQSGWHNAPAPRGLEQGAGPDFHATVLREPREGEPGRPVQAHGPGQAGRADQASPLRQSEQFRAEAALPVELRLELVAGYPLPNGDEWQRDFRLVSATRIEIADRWRLGPPEPQSREPQSRETRSQEIGRADASATRVHLVAAGEVTLHGTEAVVRDGGAGIRITTAEGVAPTTDVWELDDPELIEVWGERLTRLTYLLPTPAGTLTTVVEALNAPEARA